MMVRSYDLTKLLLLTSLIWFAAVSVALAQSEQPEAKESLSGRISHIDGQLLTFSPEKDDWIDATKETPFKVEDVLFSEKGAKAEVIMPNSTLMRLDDETEVELISLKNDLTEIDVDSGAARFMNNSKDGVLKVTTEFGDVVAPAGGSFDIYVDDVSIEIIALKGRLEFLPQDPATKHEVIAGSSSLISDGKEITPGEGKPDAKWDVWNLERDAAMEKTQ
jgi:hypothetical protein